MQITVDNQFKYRFVWYNASSRDAQYGTFLFDDPFDALETEAFLKAAFPKYEVWLEDRDGNRVPISK